MKYIIEELNGGATLRYGDEFGTIEDALEVVREYQDQDEDDEERNNV